MKKLLALSLQNKHVEQRIYCKKNADSVDIYLKGLISADYGVGAMDLRNAFAQADGADVDMHINSPGGDVFEGREMQAVIASYPGKVTAIIEGLAASAATFVTIACAEVQMVKGSRYMIHNGMTIAFGDKADMLACVELLTGFDNELAAEYAEKTKVEQSQITTWMNDETWFTAEEALEHGFVDKVNANSQNVSNVWNLSAYAKAPPMDPPADPAPIVTPAPEPAVITAEHREFLGRRVRLANLAIHQ